MPFAASRILASLALAAAALAGTSKESLPPGFTVLNSPQKGSPPQSEMMPMPLVAPLFIEDTTRTSAITMVNSASSAPLDVDVVLWALSGDQIVKQTVSIGPRGETTVSVANLLTTLPLSWPVYGSISLSPHRNSTFAAQLSISGRIAGSTDDIEEEFAMLMDEKPAKYRAVTPLETPLVAVRSLSTHQEILAIECLDKNAVRLSRTDKLSIAPNHTLLLRACADVGATAVPNIEEGALEVQGHHKSAPVALSILSSAPASKLSVFGVGRLVKGSRTGLSAIPFTDINELRSSTEVFPGAAIMATTVYGGRLSLSTTLANFSSNALTASLLLSSMGAEKVLHTFNLAPHSLSPSHLLNLPANVDGSLVVRADGTPGEVLGSIQALPISHTSSFNVPLPWKDRDQIPNGGQHPWRTDGAFLSTVMLYNPDAQQPNSVQLSLYSEGREWTKKVSLSPLSTVAVNINDIVSKQQPDDKGRTLRQDAAHGLATWFTFAQPKIFGMLVQSDLVSGLVRPYACAETYAVCDVANDPLTLSIGGSDTTYPNVSGCGTNGDCSCVESCDPGGASASTYFWSLADNSGVVSLTSNPAASYGAYKGNKAGNTYSAVSVTDSMGCSASGTGPISVIDLQSLFNQAGNVQSWTNNSDGTVSVTLNQYGNAMLDMWQCGCTSQAPPFGNPVLYPNTVVRLVALSVKLLWDWYLTNKSPSPTGTWPGFNAGSPNAPGFEPDGSGDYVKNNPDGSTDKLHPDLNDNKHGPHWDYNHYPPPGKTGAFGGRIYPDPESPGGIFVHN